MARSHLKDRLGLHQRDRMQSLIERGLPAAILMVVALLQI